MSAAVVALAPRACARRGEEFGDRFGFAWDGHMRDETGRCVDCGDER